MFRSAIAVAILVTSATVAQGAQPAKNGSSPAKQELAQRVAKLLHAETIAQGMLQRPIADALQQSYAAMQARVSPERQDAAMKDINVEAKKFLEENTPLVLESAHKYIPSTIVPLLSERFSEDELRQIIAILESPVKAKFEAQVPDLHKALGEKVANEVGPVVNPKLEDFKKRVGIRLRMAAMP